MGLSTFDAFKHVHDNADCVQISEHQLKDLQRVLVLMLRDVKAACEDASVPFFLGGGPVWGQSDTKGLFHGMMIWISICLTMILMLLRSPLIVFSPINTGFMNPRLRLDIH